MKPETAIKVYLPEYLSSQFQGLLFLGLGYITSPDHRPVCISRVNPNLLFLWMKDGFLRHLHFLYVPITPSGSWCPCHDRFQEDAQSIIPSCLQNFEKDPPKGHTSLHGTGSVAHAAFPTTPHQEPMSLPNL